MDKRFLTAFNVVMLILTCLILVLIWFFMPEQFMWGIILVFFLLLFTGFVNIMRKFPWQAMSAYDVIVVVVVLLVLFFSWFYLREQFCWAGNFILILLFIVEYLKLKKWLKDTVSIQVIIHRNEKDEDRKDK